MGISRETGEKRVLRGVDHTVSLSAFGGDFGGDVTQPVQDGLPFRGPFAALLLPGVRRPELGIRGIGPRLRSRAPQSRIKIRQAKQQLVRLCEERGGAFFPTC